MAWRSESELVRLIELREREIAPSMAGGTHDDVLIALIELADLQSELEFVRDNRDDPDAFVCATFKPKPHLNSGAIALPEPDDESPTLDLDSAERSRNRISAIQLHE